MAKKSIDDMVATMLSNLEKESGKSINEWIHIAQRSGQTKHRAILNFLKDEHGFSYGYANMVALKTLEVQSGGPKSEDDLVAAQYAGAKADLRPIYEALVAAIDGFGDDVELAPKKAYVSLRRKKQFGIIQPSTKTRVDVGINLKDTAVTERLESSGSFNSMVSHRVRLTAVAEVDAELIGWLQQAYEAAG